MSARICQPGSGQLILDPDALVTGQCVLVSEPFRFFFTRDGSKGAPADLADSAGDGVPDFVAGQLHNLLHAFHVFLNEARLPDFRKQGEMAASGVRFVDITLDNLPIQRGLASAKVQDASPAYLQGSPWAGPSVALRLHRALPLNSLTPAHELFHIFQYAALPFRNMWFMEGLARHGQRWPDSKPLKQETLPANREGLEAVLRRWHEAEPFWNRLSALCRAGEPTCLSTDRKSGEVRAALVGNPHLEGQLFLSVYFDELAGCVTGMGADMASRTLGPSSSWGPGEAKSASNNRYLLRAIDKAAVRLNSSPGPELQDFLSMLRRMEASLNREMDAPAVQQLFAVLERHGWGTVYRSSHLHLRCDAFDPVTATLSLTSLRIGAEVSSEELKAFAVVRGLVGNLLVIDCPGLTELIGFENLLSIQGSLTLERTGLIQLARSFPNLLRIKGTLRIADNRNLLAIDDFHQVESIDAALQIETAPLLQSLNVCERLVEIKKGIMSLVNCPQLHTVTGFAALARAGDILIERLAIVNLDFLAGLFARNPVYPGFIKVTTCRLVDISAMSALRSVRSSLYLHGNALENVDALGQLETIGGSLSLGANRISSLHGLACLNRIDGMLGLANNRLSTLNGLQSLKSLKTTLWNKVPRSISLFGNPSLTDLRALTNAGSDEDYLVLHCDEAVQYTQRPSAISRFHKNILQVHQGFQKKPFPTYLWTHKKTHDYGHFRLATHNKKLTYLHDFETESDILILSFAGVNGRLGGIFHNRYPLITNGVVTHKVFVNDTTHRWYHGGIPDLTRSMDETLDYLREISERQVYRKIICLGVSMGGYMALLVGHQIAATDILAFSPQTFIDSENRKRYDDRRWGKMLSQIPISAKPRYLDLACLYKTPPVAQTRIQVYYGNRIEADVQHVEHLASVTPTKLHAYDVDEHTISLYLDRTLGILNRIVLETILET